MSFKTQRLKAGMSVMDVAKHLNVSTPAIYYWENGDTLPRTEMLVRIAALYGCTTDELLKKE